MSKERRRERVGVEGKGQRAEERRGEGGETGKVEREEEAPFLSKAE